MSEDPSTARKSRAADEELDTSQHVQYEGFQRHDPIEHKEIKKHIQYTGFRRNIPNRRNLVPDRPPPVDNDSVKQDSVSKKASTTSSTKTRAADEDLDTSQHVQYEGFHRHDPKEHKEIRKHVQYTGFRRNVASPYTGKRGSASGRLEGLTKEVLSLDTSLNSSISSSIKLDASMKVEDVFKQSERTNDEKEEGISESEEQDVVPSLQTRPNLLNPPGRPSRLSIKGDLRSFFQREDSRSQLSLSVNDSAANKTFDQCYEKEDFLGEGGFAVVHRCRHKERGLRYAVKEIQNEGYEEAEGNSFKQEINNMKRLREIPYIVRLLDVFYAYDRTFLIMEEMLGGDLLDKITEKEYYPEAECRKLARRLFEAIYYCHKKRIVHRDIKPENILLQTKLDDTKIKLADFGCAKEISHDTVLVTMCGTPQYVAPEIYLQRSGYDEKCDLWSAAVVVYLLLAGYVPFDGSDWEMHKIVCAGEFEFHPQYWDEVSEPPKQFIRDLLKVDPIQRATIAEVLDTGWLKRLDREKALQRHKSDSNLLKNANMSFQNFGESISDMGAIAE